MAGSPYWSKDSSLSKVRSLPGLAAGEVHVSQESLVICVFPPRPGLILGGTKQVLNEIYGRREREKWRVREGQGRWQCG